MSTIGTKRRVAISTGGGDAPGLNAVIRAAALASIGQGWDVVGIRDGYDGLLARRRHPDGGLIKLDRQAVRGITHLGGTIIGTTNRGNPFEYPVQRRDGTVGTRDRSRELIRAIREAGIDDVIAIGGDGTLGIAARLVDKGARIVGVPKTIDNDIEHTVMTFGHDSAVDFATDALDRLHSTAEAHRRVMVVEVMGRHAGWIALNAGVSATADVILIPEIPYDIDSVCAKVRQRDANGRHFSIVVVAEGAHPIGGRHSVIGKSRAGEAVRVGGIGAALSQEIQTRTGKDCRHVVLGHLQRGGGPSSFDRLLALRFGAAAVRAIAAGRTGVMISLAPPEMREVPLADVGGRMKRVPIDCDTVLTARDLGVCLGD